MIAAIPSELGLDAYAVAVNKVAAATGRWDNYPKHKKDRNGSTGVPDVRVIGCQDE